MSKVPLHVVPGFVAAARLGNLSRAAASLHVTVSALSHQMRGLEDHLRRKLFERRPRGLALTTAGERLFEVVAPHYDALATALRPDREGPAHALTLSVLPSVASSWLVPRLPQFVAANPEIELNLQSTADLVSFDREAVDAALRFGPGTWPGLHADLLFGDWVQPVASPALLARFPAIDPSEFVRLPLLGDPSDRWRDWFEEFGGTPPRRYVASFTDTETLQRAAVEGLGVALGRLMMARPLLEAGRLVALSTQRLPAKFSHYLVYPPRSVGHPAVVAFRAWLLEAAAAYVRDDVVHAVPEPRRSRRRRSR